MELRILLRNGFDYDLWANRVWIDALGGFNRYLDRAQETLEHILAAQQIWLDRCGATVFPEQENVRLQELFEITARAWQVMLEESDGDEPITYANSRGEVFTNTIAQIAYHVLNHGTYHRGQLRGLAEADGFDGFPETDLILFLRKRDRA
jgi:uncharacterized damage-inducible protein DinB